MRDITILGIDLTVIINHCIDHSIYRISIYSYIKKEIFLRELSNSYNEIYSPMYEQLLLITGLEEKTQKLEQIALFMEDHSRRESKIRFITSSSLLEYFYDLRAVYQKYKNENNRANEKELLEKIKELNSMIDDEYWNAHDILCDNHKHFVNDSFINPFLVFFEPY